MTYWPIFIGGRSTGIDDSAYAAGDLRTGPLRERISMNDNRLDSFNHVRRRRLDDLFADQPYLSVTMKAARIHERSTDVRSQIPLTILSAVADEDIIGRQDTNRRSALVPIIDRADLASCAESHL